MQKLPKPEKPAYALASVDRALRLIQILRDRGEIRLRSVAAELGVGESTAHRLMAMLVYRGFAVQDESRAYLPGPAIGVGLAGVGWTQELIALAAPTMERLSKRTGETCNLMVRVGTKAHVLWSVEGDSPLRVISRSGAVFPLISSACGRMLLAGLPEAEVRELCALLGDPNGSELDELVRRLRLHRGSGYAVSAEGVERDVSAVGVAIRDSDLQTVAALGISVPSSRFQSMGETDLATQALRAQAAIERHVRDAALRMAER